ncbi:MAG: hypothetical protein K0R00_2723 [Herbinix sp.]|jgi:uncharacterized membrane protein YcgQ (UPF0703/DUF1980 family)|nr:hypothetical protein [Herbinix sp.]
MKKLQLLLLGCLLLLMGCQRNNPDVKLSSGNKDVSITNIPENNITITPEIEDMKDDVLVLEPLEPIEDLPTGDVIEIKEKLFIAQTNDVYFNTEDYLGKTIKYEGIFSAYEDPTSGNTYYSVIRYGPGCCGVDANAGFEVVWEKEYPEVDDWVEVVGVLEEYEEDGQTYIHLVLSSLKVLEERGKEYVSQ